MSDEELPPVIIEGTGPPPEVPEGPRKGFGLQKISLGAYRPTEALAEFEEVCRKDLPKK
jgi:hypothetical protein